MDDLNITAEPAQEAQPEIPEPSEPTQPAPIDVNALRAEIEADRRDLADKELRLAEAELDQAVSVHSNLCEQSNAAQITYDELDRKVNLAQQAFYGIYIHDSLVVASIQFCFEARLSPSLLMFKAAL